MIYLDNAATTFPKPQVVYDYSDELLRTCAFNAGRGESDESSKATEIIDTARLNIASLIPGATADHIVFTSSATDALNKIILGLDLVEGDTVYISPFEHNAIVRPLHRLEENGVKVEILPFKKENWSLDIEEMRRQFAFNNPSAVFVSHISNVTGFELPVSVIFDESSKYGSINVLDAAQSLGVFRLPNLTHCDYLIFAGHKSLYGIFGAGGFAILHDRHLLSAICGGTGSDSLNPEMPESLPQKYEAGSPNVIAIGALVKSVEWLKKTDVSSHEVMLSNYLISQLRGIPRVKIFYPQKIEPHGIVSIGVDGYTSSEVGALLNSKGIAVRTGYHCAPLIHAFIGSLPYEGTVRFSVGAFTKKEEIDSLVETLKGIV